MQKKIAVIGSGISGISAAYILSSKYKIHLFEKNDYFGGHTRTLTIPEDNNIAIDTGFIVFNDKNYPDLIKFFSQLEIYFLSFQLNLYIFLRPHVRVLLQLLVFPGHQILQLLEILVSLPKILY